MEPLEPADYFARGNAFIALSRMPEALIEYRNAVRFFPNKALYQVNLGYVLDQTGAVDEAIAAYRKALQIQPDYLQARLNLG